MGLNTVVNEIKIVTCRGTHILLACLVILWKGIRSLKVSFSVALGVMMHRQKQLERKASSVFLGRKY